MKYFLIAGERSGDLHGSNLLKELGMLDRAAVFCGFGGEQMEMAGMELKAHYSEFNVMGFLEVLKSYGKIRRYMQFAKEQIVQFSPDALILIDFGGFNMRIAKFAKRKGIRIVYYIPPKVWAWNTGRAKVLRDNVDLLLSILPFEKGFYKDLDWDIDYIGNPVNDAVRDYLSKNTKPERPEKRTIALLPGSRVQELQKISPLFLEIINKRQDLQFIIAGVENIPASLYKPFSDLNNVEIIFNDTYKTLLSSHAAVVTSGTATLETALLNIPQLVVYKASPVSYSIAKRVIKVSYISLVNLILERSLLKEFIQDDANADNVLNELERLCSNADHRAEILQGYRELRDLLGDVKASVNAARKIWEAVRQP